jgi:hypothetical protein
VQTLGTSRYDRRNEETKRLGTGIEDPRNEQEEKVVIASLQINETAPTQSLY